MPKYLNTKPGSLENAVLEAVSAAQQAAIAIAKKEKEEESVEEGFSPKEIKMAIGVAADPRYKGGNYTGAVNAIEKIKKGLSDHPQVKAVLKRVNEGTLEEKPADLLVLQFRSSSDAAKAYKVLTQKVAGNMVPYEDAYDEGDELVIEFPDDADKLMKDMKSKGAPSFKVLEREDYSDFAKTKAEELTAKQKKIDLNKNGKVDGDDLKKLRAKNEELTAKQKKIDLNKDGKIDGDDLAKLRAQKKEEVKESMDRYTAAISMWKEGWGMKKKKEEKEEPEVKGKTMTGKPLDKIEINPKDKED